MQHSTLRSCSADLTRVRLCLTLSGWNRVAIVDDISDFISSREDPLFSVEDPEDWCEQEIFEEEEEAEEEERSKNSDFVMKNDVVQHTG